MLAIAAAHGQHVSRDAIAALSVAVTLAVTPLAASPTGVTGERIPAGADAGEFGVSVFPVMSDRAYGACFLVDSTGLFITDARVADGVESVRIWIDAHRNASATVLAQDDALGIAVLGANPADLAGCRPLPLALGESTVSEGDTIAAIGVRLAGRPERWPGVVDRVRQHRVGITLPRRNRPPGTPVVNAHGDVVAVLTWLDGGYSTTNGVPVTDAIPIVSSAAEIMRQRGPPKAEVLAALPVESCPAAALQERVDRVSAHMSDYRLEAPGYRVSLLPPPVCAYLERHAGPSSPRWYLWGALEGRHPPMLAVHVQPETSTPKLLWPVVMIVKVGEGTARAVGSVVDGVTGRQRSPRRNASYCDLHLLRNGVEVEPLARQCSGQTFDGTSFSESKEGKAAFFYYSARVFDRSDGRFPRVELSIADPSKAEHRAQLELDPQTVETLAADLDLTATPASSGSPASAAAAVATPESSVGAARFRVELVGGTVVRAAAVQASGADQVKIVLSTGETLLVATHDVRRIRDDDGTDWTSRVVTERGAVP
jgi:hypothetical protein